MKLLLLIASTFADAFNALLDAYQRIAECLPDLQRYQELFDHDILLDRALEAVFSDIFDFHLKALQYFRGRSKPPTPSS